MGGAQLLKLKYKFQMLIFEDILHHFIFMTQNWNNSISANFFCSIHNLANHWYSSNLMQHLGKV